MSYTPTEWKTGDIITAPKLNNIEQGIVNLDRSNVEIVRLRFTQSGDGIWSASLESDGSDFTLQMMNDAIDAGKYIYAVGLVNGVDTVFYLSRQKIYGDATSFFCFPENGYIYTLKFSNPDSNQSDYYISFGLTCIPFYVGLTTQHGTSRIFCQWKTMQDKCMNGASVVLVDRQHIHDTNNFSFEYLISLAYDGTEYQAVFTNGSTTRTFKCTSPEDDYLELVS